MARPTRSTTSASCNGRADYLTAGDSHQQALALFREFGNRPGQAEALNRLGLLSFRTSATHQAREHHSQALAIARDIGVPLEEARALEGIGHCQVQDGNLGEGTDCLRQALAIYQRIGSPRARHAEETLRQHQHGGAVPRAGRAARLGNREALAARGDDLAVHDLLTRAGHAVFGAVLALNGVYSPHRVIKWQSHLIGELDVMPEHFAEPLHLLWTSSNTQALREAETLLTDTVQLVQARTDADNSLFCEELSQRRRAVSPPTAEHRSAAP